MKLLFLPKFLLLAICMMLLLSKVQAQSASDLAFPKHFPVAESLKSQVSGSESTGGERIDVSVTEFEAMTSEQQAEVKAQPEKYRLLGVGSLQPTSEVATDVENPKPSQPAAERYLVSKEEFKDISPEKLAFMKAHPETYDLSELDKQ